jgi:hypothetical protein
MALQKIRDREAPSDRCTHCTRCAAWDSCPGAVWISSEVLELKFDNLAVFFKDSWSNITSDFRWLRPDQWSS